MTEPKKSITTSDIAALCGVSRSTVSAIINGKRNVREATRRRVLDCIRQYHYDLGIINPSMAGEISQMVAVLAPSFDNPFYMTMFRGLTRVLTANGYHILFHSFSRRDEGNAEAMERLMSCRPAGYIIPRGAEGPNGERVRVIMEAGIPVVTLGRMDNMPTHAVAFDERQSMRLATDYVIERGHRRLGHLAGGPDSLGAKERKVGFVESLIQHDIAVSDPVIRHTENTVRGGYTAALEMLSDPATRPTAIICFNDLLAMGVYRAAHELSIEIPRELSVMGHDGTDLGELLGPPLTTVNVFPEQTGEKLGTLLVKVIKEGHSGGFLTEWIQPQLIERASVARI